MASTGPSGPDGAPAFHRVRYDAAGLRGKRLRLLADIPSNDAGDPQDRLVEVTDVIAVDGTPSVFLSLHVHPVGAPDKTAIVSIAQLGVYEQQ